HRWILCDIWLGGNKTTSFSVEKVKFVNERQGRDQPDIPVTLIFLMVFYVSLLIYMSCGAFYAE
ncbi:hypothetical protein, partial [Ectothiorhodospira shaposhnikovii]|uniref:hypothetical protein n=1 Tax=Ectothiorhodospira shaposhnikovii TaxID=1054 RepID=UPI001A928CA6